MMRSQLHATCPAHCCGQQVVAVKLRSGHQHTAVCVGSLPCSSDEERTASGKQTARKEFVIVASYCEHEGADDGGRGGAAGARRPAAPQQGLQRVQGLLSFFEIRRETAADAGAAGCLPSSV
jgi:hypothetical protein